MSASLTPNPLDGFVLPKTDYEYPYLAIYQINGHIRTEKFATFHGTAQFMIAIEDNNRGGIGLAVVYENAIVWGGNEVAVVDEDLPKSLIEANFY